MADDLLQQRVAGRASKAVVDGLESVEVQIQHGQALAAACPVQGAADLVTISTAIAATNPEVLEAHTITGAGDMLCRVVARTNADLQRVIDALVGVTGGEE